MHFCSLVHDFGQKFEILFFLSSSWWATLLMEKIAFLQSRTKVLGTALQYTCSLVISRFPLKTVHPFRNFRAVLPPPPYTKLKLGKNSEPCKALAMKSRVSSLLT